MHQLEDFQNPPNRLDDGIRVDRRNLGFDGSTSGVFWQDRSPRISCSHMCIKRSKWETGYRDDRIVQTVGDSVRASVRQRGVQLHPWVDRARNDHS
jgi:hypothetical protein